MADLNVRLRYTLAGRLVFWFCRRHCYRLAGFVAETFPMVKIEV